MRSVLTYPLVFLLSLKCGLMGIFLKMAREQTLDAMHMHCATCQDAESACPNHSCGVQRLKDREQLLWAEVFQIRARIAKLRGR